MKNQISKENTLSNHNQNSIKSDIIELINKDNKDTYEIEGKIDKNINLDETNNFDKYYFIEKNNYLNNNYYQLHSSISNNNKDLNELTFKQSKELDKRNLIIFSFSFITNKINIIKILCYSELYQYIPLLLSTYLFEILFDFTLDAFLYSDDIISKKYKNNGNLNFWTNELLSMISKLVGIIFSGIIINLTDYSIKLSLFVEEVKGNKKFYNKLLLHLKKNKSKNYYILYY